MSVNRFDVCLPQLLNEALSNSGASLLRIPVNQAKLILAELAQRAIDLDDTKLHIIMLRLGLYEVKALERVEKIKELSLKVGLCPNCGSKLLTQIVARTLNAKRCPQCGIIDL